MNRCLQVIEALHASENDEAWADKANMLSACQLSHLAQAAPFAAW